jgi:hypothetical protein
MRFIEFKKNVQHGDDLPVQLIIKGGLLVDKETGEFVRFGLPDGTEVNVMPHEHLKRRLDEAYLWRKQ